MTELAVRIDHLAKRYKLGESKQRQDIRRRYAWYGGLDVSI